MSGRGDDKKSDRLDISTSSVKDVVAELGDWQDLC